MDCKLFTLSSRDAQNQKHVAFVVGCGKWDCAHCARVNVKRFMARIIHGIEALGDEKWYLWTATLPPHERGFEKSVTAWRTKWRKLYYELKNEQKRQKWGVIHLIRVYEKHKDGTLHIHVISNQNLQSSKKRGGGWHWREEYKVKRRDHSIYYRSAWLEEKAKKVGLGYICECRPLEANKDGNDHYLIAGYVSKYLTKSDLGNYPKGFHRVEFSQQFPHLPKRIAEGVITPFSVINWGMDTINGWEMVDNTPNAHIEKLIEEYEAWYSKKYGVIAEGG